MNDLKVFSDPKELRSFMDSYDNIDWDSNKITTTVISGGFDPLHYGHLKYIEAASKLGSPYNRRLVIIANSDEWLLRKKGFVFMPLEERMQILASIVGVTYVTSWDDGTPHVSGCLEILKPDIFANGGDRIPENVPEFEICQKIGCEMVFGVGGSDKIQASSTLTQNVNQKLSSVIKEVKSLKEIYNNGNLLSDKFVTQLNKLFKTSE